MPISSTSICNLALTKVGADTIQSITQDTKAARLLNSIYESARDAVLRDHPWNFAITRTKLYPNSTTPAFEYDHEFDIPNDCLRILTIDEFERDEIDFVVEGKKILCSEPVLSIRYIYRHVDESSWDSMFCQAFAWKLATEVAYALTQSTEREEACNDKYTAAIKNARAIDGMEGQLKMFYTPEWKEARK